MLGPFVFLDIDGVLNGHSKMSNGYSRCEYTKVELLNTLLDRTNAKLVISSAWRYYVLRGEMSVQGLGGLLCTHGVKWGSVVDVLGPDKFPMDRGALVTEWFAAKYGLCHPVRYVIFDDEDYGYTTRNLTFIRTDPSVGLTTNHISLAKEFLTGA